MKHELSVENIKCGGCANSISSKLNELDSVSTVEVDIENGVVSVEAGDDMHDTIAASLLKMGYPETGTAEGIEAAAAKAKSFVSCAVGKMKS